jgi:hypothetical protein
VRQRTSGLRPERTCRARPRRRSLSHQHDGASRGPDRIAAWHSQAHDLGDGIASTSSSPLRCFSDSIRKSTCRFPQRETPLLERAVALRAPPALELGTTGAMPSGPTPPSRGKVILAAGRHIYARVEHLSSGLIIRLGVRDARRPLTNTDNYLRTRGNRRLGTIARVGWCLAVVDHPSTMAGCGIPRYCASGRRSADPLGGRGDRG